MRVMIGNPRVFRLWVLSNVLVGLLVGIGVQVIPAISLPKLDSAPARQQVNTVRKDYELGLVPDTPLGFRDEALQLEKPAGITRIVILGDSATYSSVEPGYVELLGDQYRGQRCEFINAAFSAYDVLDLYVRYERDVLLLEPDVVVVALPTATYVLYRPSIGVGLLDYGLQQIAALAEREGDELALINMPYTDSAAVTVSGVRWAGSDAEKQAYRADLREVMRESALPLYDAATELEWPDTLFRDQTHLNGEGFRQLADWLNEGLFRELCN